MANLLLARSAARRREIAMRLALGATRGRLVRQLLTESALLALGAGGLGLGLSAVASRLAQSLKLPTDIPLNLEVQTDWRVVLFTFAVAAVASVAFGLVPALQASRPSLVPALKGEGPTMSSSRRGFSLRHALVVAQITVSLVLLVAAGLFVRSVSGARTIDPGFQVDDRVVLSFNPTLAGYDADRTETFYRRLLDRVRHAPGIEHATLAGPVPLDFGIGTDEVVIEGRAVDEGQEAVQVLDAVVEADYFRTMGTRLVAGRPFSAIDTPAAPGVVIVNETMARRFWPNLDPIGRRLRIRGQGEESRVVVGVVADGKYRQLTEAPRPFMLLPLSQNPQSSLTVVVHSQRDAGSVIAAVRREALALDPTKPVFEAKSMAQHMERAYLAPRLSAWLIGPAGILALAIAAVWLAGVMAYSVSQRTRELGIRMAVGASPASVMALVMRQGLTLAAVGVALGLIGALVLSRVVSNLLFGVSPRDPITFAGVALVLLLVSAVATYLPARRALAVDPLAAFRAE